ncbi:unnamed protein product [Polarella glacialis]|uniref:Arb2 domain-containing protein n=1 Tax=Polarella glacialis TaxID=89957 RepID=A0A813HQN1_POLGL|nr:unnamed protein product [Polarella glacialis]
MPLPLPAGPAEANLVIYASPDVKEHAGPLLLLICGSAPGGAAGIWGRSVCINAGLEEGAMFDYIFRAQKLGWAVVVANPNVNSVSGISIPESESPHRHLQTLWRTYIQPSSASRVLVVAHSYGAPTMVHLLKTEPSALERVQAIAFTDGMAFPPGSLLAEVVPSEEDVAQGLPYCSEELRTTLRRFSELAPSAFEPASPEVASHLGAIGRNFVASELPAGTPIAADDQGVVAVSAGHKSHPSTTHSATEPVFQFLQKGPEGQAGPANEEVRASLI